jgi:hypothetical protein
VSTDATPTRAPDIPHSTLRGWSMDCRCPFCKSAKTATTEADSDAGTSAKGVAR